MKLNKFFRISDRTEQVTWKEAQISGCVSRLASQSFCSRTPSPEDTPTGSCLNTHTHMHSKTHTLRLKESRAGIFHPIAQMSKNF